MATKPTPEAFALLFQRFVENKCTSEETHELLKLSGEADYHQLTLDLIEAKLHEPVGAEELKDEQLQQFLQACLSNILEPKEVERTPVKRLFPIRWAAAAILLLVAGSMFFLLRPKREPKLTASIFRNDVAPGRPGAKLKLSGGRTLELDSLKDGLIASEGGYQIYKQNGEIIYKGKAGKQQEVIYNELIADKKQMSSATLPDGTIAWVNASSSVRYPIHFASNERKVTMNGEAIFKVTHNEQQPFRVYAGDKMFEDRGTEFNVNAYNQNEITTTVAEGLVQTGNTQIQPGQQAKIDAQGNVKLSKSADIETVFAWRDGQFTFSNASIEDVMKQAERWYDVEVVYEGKTDVKLIFSADRSKPISNLLQKIEQVSGVHFEINGRKVTVRP
ncbi:MAG: FecR domain-containing protein [Bacteroidota bacterium]